MSLRLPMRLLAFALALSALNLAVGQLPEAPPPHPSLDEVVKEYRRIGLPLPPINSELVRLPLGNTTWLGFRWKAGDPKTDPVYLRGTNDVWYPPVLDSKIVAVNPRVEELDNIQAIDELDWIVLAVQCRVRGWNDLANAAYSRSKTKAFTLNIEYGEPHGKMGIRNSKSVKCTMMESLRDRAFNYWCGKISQEQTDRNMILRFMKTIAPDDDMTRDLELTVAPRKSKPGSVEALIDDLTEYSEPYGDKKNSPLQKIAMRGFDAIPSLIEHMNDRRITLDTKGGGLFVPTYHIRIGDYCTCLLNEMLANGMDYASSQEEALFLYGRAQLIGEERWLLDRAMPLIQFDFTPTIEYGQPNISILRAIGAKYPNRLAPLYQTYLYKIPFAHREYIWDGFDGFIRDSRLQRGEKIALLSEGAIHPLFVHRLPALEVLSSVDEPTFSKLLLKTLKTFPTIGDVSDEGMTDCYFSREGKLVRLVQRTKNKDVWDALATATRRASAVQQERIILSVDYYDDSDFPSTRMEKISFLLRFINPDDEIGNCAMNQLSWFFDLHEQYMDLSGAAARQKFRTLLKQKAEEELKRLKK